MFVTIGTQVGSYKITALLGKGGMGEVYRATDTRLGREVAIKFCSEQFSERFEREARAVAALNHPNICTLHDVGPNYLVMELVDGMTLTERIAEGPIPFHETLGIARQIADALEAAHAKGIVHRDIKSRNIMITGRRHVKVLDFGLAKLSPHAYSQETLQRNSLTTGGIIVGTPHYLSPEVLEGASADARSDLWALGVVLYEMITGQLPFTGPTTMAIGSAILREPVPSLQASVPPTLRSIVDRCLVKRPEDRYQHASEVSGALESIQSSIALSDSGRRKPDRALSLSRRRWLWISGGVAAALAGGTFLWRRPAGIVRGRLSTGGPASANQEANDAFELAMQFGGVQNDMPRSQQMLERALALDPRFAEALRYHAVGYAFLILNGYTNDTSLLYKAEEELRQVSKLEPALPGLPAALATVYLTQGRKELVPWDQLERALREDPSHSNNRLWRGLSLWLAGDGDAAKQDFRAILSQQPLFGPARMFLAETLREDGDVGSAIRELNRVLEQAPNNISAIQNLTLAYLDNGELENARKLLEDRRTLFSRNYLWRGLWALLLASGGTREQALQAMDDDTLKFAAAAFPSTLVVAEFYAVLGDSEKAIEWLERGIRNGDERTKWFRRSPRLANIRQDPRFQQIIDSVESRRRQQTR